MPAQPQLVGAPGHVLKPRKPSAGERAKAAAAHRTATDGAAHHGVKTWPKSASAHNDATRISSAELRRMTPSDSAALGLPARRTPLNTPRKSETPRTSAYTDPRRRARRRRARRRRRRRRRPSRWSSCGAPPPSHEERRRRPYYRRRAGGRRRRPLTDRLAAPSPHPSSAPRTLGAGTRWDRSSKGCVPRSAPTTPTATPTTIARPRTRRIRVVLRRLRALTKLLPPPPPALRARAPGRLVAVAVVQVGGGRARR